MVYSVGPACIVHRKLIQDLEALGYTNVRDMKDGISGWMRAGMPVEKRRE